MPLRNIGCCYPFGKVTVAIAVSLPKPCLFIILLDNFHFTSCWQYGYGKSLLTLTQNLRLKSANNSISIHPWKLKWNLKITQLKRKILSKPNLHFGGFKMWVFLVKIQLPSCFPFKFLYGDSDWRPGRGIWQWWIALSNSSTKQRQTPCW